MKVEEPKDSVERTYRFAPAVRGAVNLLPKSLSNFEDAKQVVRAAGSVAANCLEAQEGVSRKDSFFRIKVCREESRESGLWLRLAEIGGDAALAAERDRRAGEANKL